MILLDHDDAAPMVVLQPDHAATCEQMALAWDWPVALPMPVWDRFVQGTRRHDDGWRDVEKAPLLGRCGELLGFKQMPTQVHIDIWRRGIERAGRADPYAALLIAQHARYLYVNFPREDTPEDRQLAQDFITDMAYQTNDLIDSLARGSAADRAAVDPFNLAMARRLLSFFDAFSLMLLGALPMEPMVEPIDYAERRAILDIHSDEHAPGAVLRIRPWPFAVAHLELTTRARRLEKATFTDPADAARAIADAPVTDLKWTLVRA